MKKNYNSELCDNILIHSISTIQSFGYLLILDDQLNIIQISENCAEIFNKSKEEITGLNLRQLVHLPENFDSQQETIYKTFDGKKFYGRLMMKEKYKLLELERLVNEDGLWFEDIYKKFLSINSFDNCADLVQMANRICFLLKEISGFDKVILYRFDEHFNGNVIGESCNEGMEKYLGLWFPASDIPESVRNSYYKNSYRWIQNVNSKSIPLFPAYNSITEMPSDLSEVSCRGVVPVHIQYMQNMGVASALSVAIIFDNKLWGLFTYHNINPIEVSIKRRNEFVMLAKLSLNCIRSFEANQELRKRVGLVEKVRALGAGLRSTVDFISGLLGTFEKYFDAFNISGVAIKNGSEIHLRGLTPDNEITCKILDVCQSSENQIFYCDSVKQLLKEDYPYSDIASGLLFLKLTSDICIVGFRKEKLMLYSWAGNPKERLVLSENGKEYSPRKSFQQWQETVRDYSEPWLEYEVEAASELRKMLIEKILSIEEYKRVVLEEEKFNLSLIASQSRNIIFTLRENGIVFYGNQAFHNFFSIEKESHTEIIIMNLLEDHISLDEKMILHNKLLLKNSFQITISFRTETTPRFLSMYFTNCHELNSGLTFVVVCNDVTEERRKSENLLLLSKKLERLTYSIAHDIKSPLDDLQSCLELLKDGEEEQRKKYTAIANDAVERTREFINELLSDYSKNENDFIVRNPAEIIAEVYAMLDPLQRVSFTVSSEFPPFINIGRKYFQQILHNVLSNAIKYRGMVNPSVKITYTNDILYDIIMITDNGQGIDHVTMSRISMNMYPTSSSGFGIKLVKELMHENHGEFLIESIKNRGTTIILKFLKLKNF